MRTSILLLALLAAGCGFQLRGSAELPFETLYMPQASAPGIVLDLRRSIQSGTRTRLVDDPKAAQAQLEFSQEARDKEILSLSSAGRVREYQLRYRVAFRVHDGKGNEYLPLRRVQLSRDITFSDADILAKETEEQLLFRDMQSDMVRQILNLLAASTPPKPAAQ